MRGRTISDVMPDIELNRSAAGIPAAKQAVAGSGNRRASVAVCCAAASGQPKAAAIANAALPNHAASHRPLPPETLSHLPDPSTAPPPSLGLCFRRASPILPRQPLWQRGGDGPGLLCPPTATVSAQRSRSSGGRRLERPAGAARPWRGGGIRRASAAQRRDADAEDFSRMFRRACRSCRGAAPRRPRPRRHSGAR